MTWGFAVIALLTILSYRSVWTAGWVYEDANAVQANPSVTGKTPIAIDRARWLSALSHRIVFAAVGERPRVHHLVNLALHLINGALVYVIAGAFVAPIGALLAAAVFLLHPIQSEAVAYVASRSELLATCFALLAFWRALEARRWHEHLLVWVAVLAAVCAKESAAVIVPLIAITDAFRNRRLSLWRYAVLLLPVVWMGYSIFRFDYLTRAELTPMAYAATQATAVWRYLAITVLPIGQNVDHDFDLVAWGWRWLALAGIGVLALVPITASLEYIDGDHKRVLRTWDQWRGARPMAFGIAWFLIALSPRFVMRIPEVLNEHQFYVPFVGLCLALSAILTPFLDTQETHG